MVWRRRGVGYWETRFCQEVLLLWLLTRTHATLALTKNFYLPSASSGKLQVVVTVCSVCGCVLMALEFILSSLSSNTNFYTFLLASFRHLSPPCSAGLLNFYTLNPSTTKLVYFYCTSVFSPTYCTPSHICVGVCVYAYALRERSEFMKRSTQLIWSFTSRKRIISRIFFQFHSEIITGCASFWGYSHKILRRWRH